MGYPGKVVRQSIVSQKIIANLNEGLRKCYDIPEGHESVGILSTDYQDILYCAIDDASKKTQIEVVSCGTYYGGSSVKWSKDSGAVFAMISGPNVADVRSAMQSIDDYVRRQPFLYDLAGDGSGLYFAGLISGAGRYFQKMLGVGRDTCLAYLSGAPVDAMYAIDQALKGGNVEVAKLYAPPHSDNCATAILSGTEAACKNSLEAFARAMEQCFRDPARL